MRNETSETLVKCKEHSDVQRGHFMLGINQVKTCRLNRSTLIGGSIHNKRTDLQTSVNCSDSSRYKALQRPCSILSVSMLAYMLTHCCGYTADRHIVCAWVLTV